MILTGLALGLLLGYVMQRGRFCVTGMIRDIFTQRSWRGFTALLIVIAVHAIGLAALASTGVIAPEYDDFAPVAVILGGLLFGMGIVLAGGCASGTWYRSGEGLVGSWIALITYGLSAAAMKAGALTWLRETLRGITVPATTIHGSLGISVWWLAIPFAVGVAYLAAHFLSQEKAQAPMAQLPARKQGLAHILAEKPWHFYSTAVIVGVLGVIAWPLSAATGRNDGLGITTPTSDLVRYVTTGDSGRLTWGTMLVLGLLFGAFAAAKASGEFRVRVPDPGQAVRSVVGGIMMGIGAVLAGGCTVGNGMVATSLFTYQGWVALVFIAAGIWVGAKLWLKSSDNSVHSTSLPDATPAASVRQAEPFSFATAPAGVLTLERTAVPAAVATGVAAVNAKEASGLRSVGEGKYALDTLGAVCPFPLIDAKAAMAQLETGEELVIDFDCTQATDSIPRWAATDGHEVTNYRATGDAGWTITVKKG